MLYKIGTVAETNKIKNNLPPEAYQEALRIAVILDDNYGADRDVDENDGGYVLIAETVEDVAAINERYIRLDSDTHEFVTLIKCEDKPYISVLYLCNNDFGISVLLPQSICPQILLNDLE